MAIMGTLCQVVEERALRDPGKVFCRLQKAGGEQVITYGDLLEKASLYGGAYQELGIDRGANIFIQLSLGEDLVYSFVGAMLGGYIPSFVAPPEIARNRPITGSSCFINVSASRGLGC